MWLVRHLKENGVHGTIRMTCQSNGEVNHEPTLLKTIRIAHVLSELTYQALGEQKDKFEFVDLGKVEIRGKSQKMRVYGLRCLAYDH